jgi:two-component system chemotaxis response regulator CheB
MTGPQPKRRVLIVDDSILLRRTLASILNSHPGLEVVGECADPYEARERIRELDPDVLTLDIEMPRMDGLTFLRKLMRAHPMPVVMVSSLAAKGTDVAMEALELGALDVIWKPRLSELRESSAVAQDIAEAVYEASFAQILLRPGTARPVSSQQGPQASGSRSPDRALIAVGASTGGTDALREIFSALPQELPPIAVVQHILPGFIEAFVQRLDSCCALRVKVAAHGERAEPGTVYFAPSQVHLSLTGPAAQPSFELHGGDRVSRHLPSVDVLFRSTARVCGPRACGIILTGMGSDGAKGLLEMARSGAETIGQDEETCVIYGMPRAAARLGAVKAQLPVSDIPAHLTRWARGG